MNALRGIRTLLDLLASFLPLTRDGTRLVVSRQDGPRRLRDEARYEILPRFPCDVFVDYAGRYPIALEAAIAVVERHEVTRFTRKGVRT